MTSETTLTLGAHSQNRNALDATKQVDRTHTSESELSSSLELSFSSFFSTTFTSVFSSSSSSLCYRTSRRKGHGH